MDTTAPRLRLYGVVTIVTALLGTACAAAILAWPEQVPETQWSHPFDATSFAVAQVVFAVHHLGLFPALLVVLALARGHSRSARAGLLIGIVAMAALTVTELVAIGAAEAATDSAQVDAMGGAYGFATMGLGLGFLMSGIALARRPVLPGATGRWVFLVIGVWIFFPMLPTLFMPLVYGRITIGIWLLLYAGIGVAMLRLARETGSAPSLPAPRRATSAPLPADQPASG